MEIIDKLNNTIYYFRDMLKFATNKHTFFQAHM